MSTVLIPALSNSTAYPRQQLIFYRKFVAMVKQPQIYHVDENSRKQTQLPLAAVLKIFSAIAIISPISPLFIFKFKSQ